MARYVHTYVENVSDCRRDLHHTTHQRLLQLFPFYGLSELVPMDILCPLSKTKSGGPLSVVITDRFTELTRTIPTKKDDSRTCRPGIPGRSGNAPWDTRAFLDR